MKTTMKTLDAMAYKDETPGTVIVINGETADVYTGKDIPEYMKQPRLISVQEFRDRFTSTETDAFIDATRTDDNIAKLQFKLSTAQEPLDLDGETLQQGMLYLVAVGVITEARRVEILS